MATRLRPLRLLPIVAAATGLWVSVVFAGYRLTGKDGDQTLVSKGRVKELSGGGEGPQSVFDLGNARSWISNPERKVYWEGTINELCTTIKETALDKASALMSRVSSCAAAGDPDPSRPKDVDEGKVYQQLYPRGWPLKAVSYADGKTRTKNEITAIEPRDVPDREFMPPAGFRKAPLAEVM